MSSPESGKPLLASLVQAGQGQTEAEAVNDFIWMVKDISNAYLVRTEDGDVLVNTGFMDYAERNKALFAKVRRGPLRRIILGGAVFAVAYQAVAVVASSVWMLATAQILNALFIAATSGLGISYVQDMMPRYPGRATTLFTNALVFDGTALDGPDALRALYDFFHPWLGRLAANGRVNRMLEKESELAAARRR